MPQRHVRIVQLWLRDGDIAAFEAFEREAVRIMARHGGRIDQAIRLAAGQGADAPFEIHVVSFPDASGFAAYAQNPETLALRARREAIIARTEVVSGLEAGPY